MSVKEEERPSFVAQVSLMPHKWIYLGFSYLQLSRVSGNYTLRNAFNDLSLVLELILNSPDVKRLVSPDLLGLADVLKRVPDWIEKFKALPESYDGL